MGDTVADWLDLVDARHPTATAQDWDHVGLQVGRPEDPVHRVLVTLDVTAAVVDEAAVEPATMVLAHHPLLLRPLPALTPATARGRVALQAARRGVTVAAAHTNLDVATDGAGTSTPVVRVLGLGDVVGLQAPDDPTTPSLGVRGRLATTATLGEVATRLVRDLPAPDLRFAGDRDRRIESVAVVGGAGDSLLDTVLASGVDLFVTGDLRHHVALDALELGLAVIDAGHHAVEVAALPHWIDLLRGDATRRSLTASVVASGVSTRPWTDLAEPAPGTAAGPPSQERN